MNVNPGPQFLSGLPVDPTYPIEVPPSGGAIIQGEDGSTIWISDDGTRYWLNPDGTIKPIP